MTSIYDIPLIAHLMDAERKETNPELKRLFHNMWIREAKQEQANRANN